MKSILTRVLVASALSIGIVPTITSCSSDDDNVDSVNGKAISDLDIGGDLALDSGKSQQMQATLEYADGTSRDVTRSDDLVWNIGNTNVATINRDGVVTGVAIGATTIRATYQNQQSDSQALIVK